MSDLISRSALLKHLSDWKLQEAPYGICDEETEIYKTICECIEAVKEQPIAYDKEAVVKQLENEEKFWESSYDYQIGKEKARSYGHAIELVKAGGIDG